MDNEDPLSREIRLKYEKIKEESQLKKSTQSINYPVIITSIFMGTATIIGVIQILIRFLY